MKNIVVQKFGGTSVADIEKMKHVADVIIKEKENGNDVIVVVSAMGHTTDHLVKLAHDINPNPSERELDMLLSTGECVSMSLLTMALQAKGHKAVSYNAAQIGIITENVHTKARIIDIKTDKLRKSLDEGNIIVIAGFQGVTTEGEITTLGRGGSDTSAVAIASALGAERCDIYTDVEGVYTTDPRVVPTASRLNQISYEEMLELAHAGANVLHPRSVETAKQYKMPLRVRSTFKYDNKGTLILGVEDMEINKPVAGVAADLSQVRVVVCDIPDTPANQNISVDMIIQSYARKVKNDIAFTISKEDLQKTQEILSSVKEKLEAGDVSFDDNIAKVSIIGAGMIDRPGIASTMFKTLADAGINIRMISTSEIKISCLINKEDAQKAVKALHEVFNLGCDEIAEVKGTLPDV